MRRKTILCVWYLAAVAVTGAAAVSRLDAASQARSASSAADTWNTLSADVTIRHSRVTAEGKSTGEATPVVQYHWERRLTASGWKSTMTLQSEPLVKLQTLSGERQLDNPFVISRIEDDEDGTPIRLFNRNGDQVRPPSEAELGRFNRGRASSLATDPSLEAATVRPQTFSREWSDSLVASPAKTGDRRAALERRHGKAVGRVRGLDRFLTTKADETMEVLADPQSALPVEINAVENGALVAHTTIGYAAGADGLLVRRVVRAERVTPRQNGERTVTDVELANVRLEQRR